VESNVGKNFDTAIVGLKTVQILYADVVKKNLNSTDFKQFDILALCKTAFRASEKLSEAAVVRPDQFDSRHR
jgi:hypothetical protein